MNNIAKLLKGEIQRSIKYMILPISLLTSVIWVIIFLLISADEAKTVAPLFLFADVAVMSIILVGASYYLEKQEGTINSVLMLPIKLHEILIAKFISSMFLAFESVIIIALSLYLIHGIYFNYLLLLFYVIISAMAHTAMGFSLALYAKDFNSLLGLMMTFMLVFTLPTIFYSLTLIPENFEVFLFLSPSHCADLLMNYAIQSKPIDWKVILSVGYQIVIACGLFKYVIYPKFKSNTVRG